jgi:ferredoxin-fold anticodon binding domain-containing protein
MKNFGELKTKMLTKLTESYSKENKKEVKNILNTIKENKAFKEMYLFYEEIENKYFDDKEIAKLYVEGLNTYFGQPMGNWNDLNMFCESLNEKLGLVEITTNELYESLDVLSEKDSLSNLEKKVKAKKKLVDHLTTKKEIVESVSGSITPNESLLHAVLANNFNVLYSNTMNESQKEELKNILSLSEDELNTKTTELKESILTQVGSLLSESNDTELTNKLSNVEKEVKDMKPSKYNYYRLNELKNGLN